MAMVMGRLQVLVKRAEGRTRTGGSGWADVPKGSELFVKVEMRGAPDTKAQKVNTNAVKVKDDKIVLNTQIDLNIVDGTEELRILVCKKKEAAGNVATVIAAAGIYVRDITKMVGTISKDFDLFKPGGKGDLGGVVSLELKYFPHTEATAAATATAAETASTSKAAGGEKKQKKGGFGLVKLLLLAGVGAGAFFAVKDQKKGGDARRTEEGESFRARRSATCAGGTHVPPDHSTWEAKEGDES
eukprot:CAMPEP_0119133076 /NCGR_PEP_ID=MMETSP1310-20130426/12933_1 /TAXON_ID=464262 /ORGANISM="Genus nov. species nov., Strain RCC2339" /LENGTH=242 /DNA_ID=CAMNT_0007123751 /DNA_START=11 /DNA_END=740 /DNA_ORIENTATION=+